VFVLAHGFTGRQVVRKLVLNAVTLVFSVLDIAYIFRALVVLVAAVVRFILGYLVPEILVFLGLARFK
jgi:hypothetical protein